MLSHGLKNDHAAFIKLFNDYTCRQVVKSFANLILESPDSSNIVAVKLQEGDMGTSEEVQ